MSLLLLFTATQWFVCSFIIALMQNASDPVHYSWIIWSRNL